MLSSFMLSTRQRGDEMDRIPPWAINKGIKIIGKKGQGQIEGGDDSYGTGAGGPLIGTVNGTNGGEVKTDQIAAWLRNVGGEQFDYGAFTAAVERRVNAGMSATRAFGRGL